MFSSLARRTGSTALSSDSTRTTSISHLAPGSARRNSAELRLRPTKHRNPAQSMSGLLRSPIWIVFPRNLVGLFLVAEMFPVCSRDARPIVLKLMLPCKSRLLRVRVWTARRGSNGVAVGDRGLHPWCYRSPFMWHCGNWCYCRVMWRYGAGFSVSGRPAVKWQAM